MKSSYLRFTKAIFIYIAFIFFCNNKPLFSQDFHLSQYDAPPLFLNPAFTGLVDGKVRFHGQARNQWRKVNNRPYTVNILSCDAPLKQFGVGLQVMNGRAGIGEYNAFSLLLSVGYDVILDKPKTHHLSFGIQSGFTRKSIDQIKLTFANQYTTNNGGMFDLTLPSFEQITNPTFTLPNLNAGVLYFFSKDETKLNPFAGYSVFNLIKAKESFTAQVNKTQTRHFFHGGVKININDKLQFLPKFIYCKQGASEEKMISLLLHYFLDNETTTFLMFGLTNRYNSAVIMETGLRKENYMFRVSYDINLLKHLNILPGGIEISLTYVLKNNKPTAYIRKCPRL